MTSSAFASLGLDPRLLQALTDLNFTEPTPVQAKAIPNLLQSTDWMVTSQTGTGKTAAFLLPTLHRIAATLDAAKAAAAALSESDAPTNDAAPTGFGQPERERKQNFSNRPGKRSDRHDRRSGNGYGRNTPCEPLALVLCPTRELAQQVANDAIKLVKHLRGVHVATIIGGMPFGKQIQQLRGANLVVATPGRLLDLFQQKAIVLNKVEVLIADEADRMLDMGFVDDLHAISSACSNHSQTLMFSATFAANVVRLGQAVMNNPQRLDLAPITQRNVNITQTLHWVDNNHHKNQILDHWLRDPAIDQAIVFASTQMDTENLAERLDEAGFAAVALHGAMPQAVRNRRLTGLREGRFKVLVATDVAARGIDVSTITHVFNFGLPMKPEDYVHRIGRTGRAGRTGLAITLAEPRDRFKIRAIEQITRQNMTASVIEGLEPQVRAAPSGGRRNFSDKPQWGRPGHSKDGFAGRRHEPHNFSHRQPAVNAQDARQNFSKPSFTKPAFGKPAFEKPAFEKPAFGKPSFGKPSFDKTGSGKTGFDRGDVARPAFGKPAFAKPAFEKPAFEKPAYAKPGFAKPAFAKPAFDKSSPAKSGFGKPSFGKPSFKKPGFDKAAASR